MPHTIYVVIVVSLAVWVVYRASRHRREDKRQVCGSRCDVRFQRAGLRLEPLEPRILLSGSSPDAYEPNDSFDTAVDLGPMSGTEALQDLTVHDWGDWDYFTFSISDTGTGSDHVGLQITEGSAHMGMALYDADRNYVDSRDGWPTLELPLEGVSEGTYYLEVAGMEGAEVVYDLTFATPSAVEGDPYEVNDSFGAATGLGEVEDVAHLPLATIHDGEDVDYFHFTTTQEGTAKHYVEIQFDHDQGDLDMALYDGGQNYLLSSKTLTDDERISLEGRPAGDYYAHVYGYLGATNEYDLMVVCADDGLTPDANEPNDSFPAATDFGDVGGYRLQRDLTIHGPSDEDYFALTTLEESLPGHYAEIQFDHASGDLDLELYDGTEQLLRSATSGTDDERVSLAGLDAGKYYLRVTGYEGATNAYDLLLIVPQRDWAEDAYEYNDSYDYASDLGELEGTREIPDLTITPGDLDYFEFSTVGTGAPCHYADIRFTHGEGNLDMELHYEDEVHLFGSATTGTDDERISFAGLPAGTYYLLVYGRGDAANGYDLTFETPREGWDADGEEVNDDFETATDLTGQPGSATLSGLTVHSDADEDYFAFSTIATPTDSHGVEIEFSHAEGDLDLELFDGSRNHLLSATSISDDERISLEGLAAGTYFARVFGYSGATNGYDLTINTPFPELAPDDYEPNDERESATQLREITGQETLPGLTVHDGQDLDYFAFTLVEEATDSHYVEIQFAHGDGNLNLYLYSGGESWSYLTGSTGLTDDERISLDGFNPGDYVVKVAGADGATNGYDLVIVGREPVLPDQYEENDYPEQAANLGRIRGVQHISGLNRHDGGDDDYFRFVTSGEETTSHYVEILFNDDDGDLEMMLGNEMWEILDRAESNTDDERISLGGLPAGTYLLRVHGGWGARNGYDLVLHMPAGVAPDGWEDTEPLELRGNETLEGLTVHDPGEWEGYGTAMDVFEFTTASTPGPAHYVQIDFAHADGDLNMRLLDPMGRLVREGWSVTDNETIEMDGLPSGSYTLEVYGAGGDVNAYDLTVNLPFFTAPLPKWTLLFYMDGDDWSGSQANPWSCETYALHKINEMESLRLPYDLQVGVLLDRIESYSSTNPDWTDTRVGVLRHDRDDPSLATRFEAWEPVERNVGQSTTLESYLNWASVALPAEHYGLFLFDHGGGFHGVCWDETSGDDQLTLSELHEALDGAAVSVDVIGFDACLMQMTEVAYALSDVVDVVVGSEDVELVPGWDNRSFMARMVRDPDCSPLQLASHLVESYGSHWGDEGTLSAVDTSTFPLYNSLRTFTHNVLELADSSAWQSIADARNTALGYYVDDFRDLGSFLGQVWMRVSQPSIKWSAYGAWSDLRDMVIANHTGDEGSSSGLSIYLPEPEADYINGTYRTVDFGGETGWLEFVEELVDVGLVQSAEPDWAESNDARATAYDFHTLVGDGWVYPYLSMHNVGTPNGPVPSHDWFRFTTINTADAGDEVRIEFDHDEGDLNLAVYSSENALVGSSYTWGDEESVSLEGRGPDTYYVVVTGRSNAENPEYTLRIDAPPSLVVPVDWAAGNVSQQKAVELDLAPGAPQSGLYVGAGEEDWFSCTTSMLAWQAALTVTASYDAAQYDLTLDVCDPDGNVLATSQETAEGAVVSLAGAESGRWHLKVTTPSPGDFVPYTLTVEENVGPDVTVHDPAAGATAGIGDVVTLSWDVFDPDDDAEVTLYWDADADPDNNDPADQGVTWGPIAAGLRKQTTSFDWTVDVPGSGQYHLCAVAEDASLSDTDYTATTLGVRSLSLIASERVDGALISLYDADPSNGVSAPNVAWSLREYEHGTTDVLVHPGRTGDGVINRISLHGDGSRTADLGFIVEGNMPLRRFADLRSAGPELGFLVSEGYVGNVNLRSGLSGMNLNGFTTPGGWELPGDLDGDGALDDSAAFYGRGGLRLLNARGDVRGDLIAGAEVGLVNVLGGGLLGDVRLTGGDIGRVTAVGGDISGNVTTPDGDIGHVQATALYDRSTASWVGGSVTGDVSAGGDVGAVVGVRGADGISGRITAAGAIGMVRAISGDISGGAIEAGGDLRMVQSVDGSISDPVCAGGDLRLLRAVNGGISGPVDAAGDVRVIQAIGGDLAGGLDIGGSLRLAMAIGQRGTGGHVSSPVDVAGDLRVLKAVGGSIAAPVTVGGDATLVQSLGGDVAAPVNVAGTLRSLSAIGRGSTGGNVEQSVGAVTGLFSLLATGDLTGDVSVTGGDLNRVTVLGSVRESRLEASGDLASLFVRQNVGLAHLGAGGLFRNASVLGDFANSTIEAGELGRVMVRGRIWQNDTDGDADLIRAETGRFFAMDSTWRGWVEDAAGYWFDQAEPHGVHAYVG